MSQNSVAELAKTYADAQQKIIDILSQKHKGKTNTYHEQRILKQTNTVLRQLIKDSKLWTNSNVPREYKKAVRRAITQYKDLGIETKEYDDNDKRHNKQIEILVRNTTDDLVKANLFISRNIKDNIRQITLKTIAESRATGRNINQIRDDLKNQYINNNITSIVSKNGRHINLDAYASTVARSVMTEVENTAVIEQVKENGNDLVKMSSHPTTCPICAPLQGRVYSISGETKGYPKLDRAFGGGHANIHPNCRHFLIPYFPERDKDRKETKAFSNRSFNTDPRSQRQINNYNNEQKRNRQRNEDLRQWQRYRTVMPSETSKNFAGFRKSKRANSKRYQQLVSQYRSIRQSQQVE